MHVCLSVCLHVCMYACMLQAMVIDAFHCGKHIWGRRSCCEECDDW